MLTPIGLRKQFESEHAKMRLYSIDRGADGEYSSPSTLQAWLAYVVCAKMNGVVSTSMHDVRETKPRKRCHIRLSMDGRGEIGGAGWRHGGLRYVFPRHPTNTVGQILRTFRTQWRQDNGAKRVA